MSTPPLSRAHTQTSSATSADFTLNHSELAEGEDTDLSLEERIVRRATKAVVRGKVCDDQETSIRYSVQLSFRFAQRTSYVICDFKLRPHFEMKLETLKRKRRKYTHEEKRLISETADEGSMSSTIKELKRKQGFELVRAQQIRAWQVPKVHKKSGRPINSAFETEVLDRLIYAQLENSNDPNAVQVSANVAYSYNVIIRAAKLAQALPQFQNDPVIGKLKFTHPWVGGFLSRSGLARRRVTSIMKTIPPPHVVQEHMEGIQNQIMESKFELSEIVSADETGIMYGEKPKNQYVPIGARGMAPEGDDKARFTAMLWSSANGEMHSPLIIIKCSSTKPDLSGTRVVHNLLNQAGFQSTDGWALHLWERNLEMVNQKTKQLQLINFKRPYLKHMDGTIILCQAKAWMDTPGIAMWIDVQLGPYFKAKRGKAALIWDNCGSHKVQCLEAVFKQWGIVSLPLPPKMTDHLQVMDLVVNGPVKSGIRRDRIDGLFNYFQTWKFQRAQQLALPASERNFSAFSPPKPTLTCGLLSLLKICRSTFKTDNFKANLKRVFVEVCQAPKEDGSFQRYCNHQRGSMAKALFKVESVGTNDACVAALCADVEVRAEADECENEDERSEVEDNDDE